MCPHSLHPAVSQARSIILPPAAADKQSKSGLQVVLEGMGELWDEDQSPRDFDMQSFVRKLSSPQQ